MTIVDSPKASGAPAPVAEAGLQLHKFVKNDSWRGALTADRKGRNLPSHGSLWIYQKEVLVSPGDRRVGASSHEIIRGISERGYFLFPIGDDV